MKRNLRRHLCAIAMLLLTPAIATADVVLDWNRIMVSMSPVRTRSLRLGSERSPNWRCSRRSMPARTNTSRISPPARAYAASAEAAAVAAAHGVLKNYFPAAADALDTARAQSLAAIPDGRPKRDGIAVGEAAAAAMILARANDGAAPPETFLPATADPGIWQPTPPAFGPGTLLHWRNLTLFGLASSDQYRSEPPPALTSRRYTKDYREVMAVGSVDSSNRPQDRTDVARFFAAASATYAWNTAVQQVSAAVGLSVSQNARAFALVNMAISDALVASMETKYHYLFWRPVTAIRAGHLDGIR